MLSKAEIQYLQGQKHVSKSYERTLKYLIRKKIEVLQKEIPLLSNLLTDKIQCVLSKILDEREAQHSFLKSKEHDYLLLKQYSDNEQVATEFRNASMSDNGFKDRNIADHEGLEGLKSSSNLQKIIGATDFDNARDKNATKNRNFVLNQRRERDLNSVVILEETSIFLK